MDSFNLIRAFCVGALLFVLSGCQTTTNAEWDSAERRADECFNNPGLRGNPYCLAK